MKSTTPQHGYAAHRRANIVTLIAREQGEGKRGGQKKFVAKVLAAFPESTLTGNFVSQFVGGKPVPDERAQEIESAYGLDPGCLDLPSLGNYEMNSESDAGTQQQPLQAERPDWQTPSKYVPIKLFENPSSTDDRIIKVNHDKLQQYISVLRGYMISVGIKNPENIDIMQMQGQSMGATAPHGCLALVDRTKTRFQEEEGVFVIRWHNGVIMKRLLPEFGGRVLVQSDNPDKVRYQSVSVPRAEIDRTEILAQVVFVIKGHKVV